MCMEKRPKGRTQLSKENRKASLPQVQLLYASSVGVIKEEGGVIIRAKPTSDEGSLFQQSFLGFKCQSRL